MHIYQHIFETCVVVVWLDCIAMILKLIQTSSYFWCTHSITAKCTVIYGLSQKPVLYTCRVSFAKKNIIGVFCTVDHGYALSMCSCLDFAHVKFSFILEYHYITIQYITLQYSTVQYSTHPGLSPISSDSLPALNWQWRHTSNSGRIQ